MEFQIEEKLSLNLLSIVVKKFCISSVLFTTFNAFAIPNADSEIFDFHLSNQSASIFIKFGIHLSESEAGHSSVGE
jgi:hypothetical protein